MNCNLCPYQSMCTQAKQEFTTYMNGTRIFSTIPEDIEKCALYRVITRESEGNGK